MTRVHCFQADWDIYRKNYNITLQQQKLQLESMSALLEKRKVSQREYVAVFTQFLLIPRPEEEEVLRYLLSL